VKNQFIVWVIGKREMKEIFGIVEKVFSCGLRGVVCSPMKVTYNKRTGNLRVLFFYLLFLSHDTLAPWSQTYSHENGEIPKALKRKD